MANNKVPAVSRYGAIIASDSMYFRTTIRYSISQRVPSGFAHGSMSGATQKGPHPTEESSKFMEKQTSLWLQRIVNAGWFSCDRAIYTEERLREILNDPTIAKTCLYDTDQTGLNLLLAMAGVKPCNLNLPPSLMEFTWAVTTLRSLSRSGRTEKASPSLFTGRDQCSTKIVPSMNSFISISRRRKDKSG